MGGTSALSPSYGAVCKLNPAPPEIPSIAWGRQRSTHDYHCEGLD